MTKKILTVALTVFALSALPAMAQVSDQGQTPQQEQTQTKKAKHSKTEGKKKHHKKGHKHGKSHQRQVCPESNCPARPCPPAPPCNPACAPDSACVPGCAPAPGCNPVCNQAPRNGIGWNPSWTANPSGNPLFEGIELNESQKTAVKKARDKRHESMKDAGEKLRKEGKKASEKFDKEVMKVLTPAQQAQYKANKEKMANERNARREKGKVDRKHFPSGKKVVKGPKPQIMTESK